MSSELVSGPLDDCYEALAPGETEFSMEDGRVIIARYFVGVVGEDNGIPALVPLTMLTYTMRKSMELHEAVIKDFPRSALLWIHQVFEPGRPEDVTALAAHRAALAAERGEATQ